MALDLNEPIIINFDYIGERIKVTTHPAGEVADATDKHRKDLQPKKGLAGGGALRVQFANNNLFAASVAKIDGLIGLTKEPGTQGWWKRIPRAIINTTCDRLMSTDDDFDVDNETDDDGALSDTAASD